MSRWSVIVNNLAEKRLAKLARQERERISNAIDKLGDDPFGAFMDVKKLKARPEWRLRVGKWRVLFRVEYKIVTVMVVDIDTRGDAYK